MTDVRRVAEGPYFDELAVGQVFDGAPAVTLTSGQAAAHQAIVGDRLALPLDSALAAETTGLAQPAHPSLVWDLAIGQSTVATHHVKALPAHPVATSRRCPSKIWRHGRFVPNNAIRTLARRGC